MIHSKTEWVELLERELPSKEMIVDRNMAITSHYARWYLARPQTFKWSGMASFASRQVGVALLFSELMHNPERMLSVGSGDGLMQEAARLLGMPLLLLHNFASGPFMLQDLDVLRKGNNSIFEDIGWAHAAYMEGGLDEIESNTAETGQELLLEGFRMVDRGVNALGRKEDEPAAKELIWEGNSKLLRHEQINTLQPLFDTMSPLGKILASFGSELDFSAGFSSDPARHASFSTHFGFLSTLTGQRSVTDSRHRWEWIAERVMPVWKGVDCDICEGTGLKPVVELMAAGESGPLNQLLSTASGFFNVS